jgi:hypothetical protein
MGLMRELRSCWSGPVIIVSGRGESVERVIGLELGADHYVSKPFDLGAAGVAGGVCGEPGARDRSALALGVPSRHIRCI